MEAPAHSFFESSDLRHGRAGDRGERDVARVQMHETAAEMVAEIGATGAAFFPVRAKHEVIDDELGFAAKEIGERLFSVGAIEDVVLFDFDPREFAALGAEGITLASELLFGGQKLFASGEPLVLRDDFVFQRNCGSCGTHFPFSFRFIPCEMFAAIFLLRRSLMEAAATPPVEMAPVTTSAIVAKHSGHMRVLLGEAGRSSAAPLRREISGGLGFLREQRRLVGAGAPTGWDGNTENTQVDAELAAVLVPVTEHDIAQKLRARQSQN